MQTGKLIGGKMDTAMRWCGQFFTSPRSRTECVRDQFGDVDSSRLRTVCGQFESVAAADSRTAESAAFPRTRTVRGRACLRGLNADMDSSRTWSFPDRIAVADLPGSRPCAAHFMRTFRVFTATASRTQKPCASKG